MNGARGCRRLPTLTAAALTVPLLGGCSGPLSILEPAGPMAQGVAWLWWLMAIFFSLVLLAVGALWIHALRRTPREVTVVEARRIEKCWLIGGGLILPGVSILALLLLGTPVGQRMLPLPVEGEQPLRIDITAHQWWWEVRYPDSGVVTANQLHIPAGRPVDLHLGSADVIHSFWVPRLGGKLDMIPGRTNVLRLQADQPGTYRGQCAEFCGTQHTHMQIVVIAHAEADYLAWVEERTERRVPPLAGAAGEIFATHCGTCHRVAGVSDGARAPDLSDIGSRPTLGAGVLRNEPGAIARWLHEHRRLKQGNGMPAHDDIDDNQLDAIAEWLETLAP